jgi:L-amino acid N-acyltransferase YncA
VDIEITNMAPGHWPAVALIYEDGIATGTATFETTVPGWEAWDRSHLAAPRLVAVEDDEVLAWAALSPYSARPVYAGVADVSIYVAARARRKGVGKALLNGLVKASEERGLWTLQAGIMSVNAASLALHQRCGFRIVGTRERIGRLGSEWRDVVLMERRSRQVGI